MRARGEGQGGLFLGRFYSRKGLAFPVLRHKIKVLVLFSSYFSVNSVSNKIADLETFINDNKDTLNTTLFTTVLDMMRSIENQINLNMKLRSGTGRVPTL